MHARTPRHVLAQQTTRDRVGSQIIDHFKKETTTIKTRSKLTKNMTNATISLTAPSAASRHQHQHHHQHHHHNQHPNDKTSGRTSSRNKTSHLMLAAIMLSMVHLSALVTLEAKPMGQYQVKFKRVPRKELSAAFGASVTLECQASSSPPPTIHWLKDGKRIVQNELDENRLDDVSAISGSTAPIDDTTRMALSTTRSRLYLDCIDATDEATYTCVAENAYSRVASQTRLSLIRPASSQADLGGENELVSAEEAALSELKSLDGGAPVSAVPQCVSERIQTGFMPRPPARIHLWSHNVAEIMKNSVVLLCRSNARAASSASSIQEVGNTSGQMATRQTVSWTLPNERAVSEDLKDKYEVLETGDLLIKDLSWADMGSYVCTVSDEQTSDSVSSFVYPMAPGKAAPGIKRTAALGGTGPIGR